VVFLAGRFDANAPPELTRKYFERLDAPGGKRMTWFDESAHDIFFDQPQLLVEELIRIKGE